MHLITHFFKVNILIFFLHWKKKDLHLAKCIPSRTSKTSLIISSSTNFTLKIFHGKFNDCDDQNFNPSKYENFLNIQQFLEKPYFPSNNSVIFIPNYPGSNFMFCKFKHLSSLIFLKQHWVLFHDHHISKHNMLAILQKIRC